MALTAALLGVDVASLLEQYFTDYQTFRYLEYPKMPDFAFAANSTPIQYFVGVGHVLFVWRHRRAIFGRLQGYLRLNSVMLTRSLRLIFAVEYLIENTR